MLYWLRCRQESCTVACVSELYVRFDFVAKEKRQCDGFAAAWLRLSTACPCYLVQRTLDLLTKCYMMVIDLLAVASHYQMPLGYKALRLQSMG